MDILEISVKEKEVEGKKFYCIEIEDTRSTHRVWINPSYFHDEIEGKQPKKYFLGIFRNARIEKTQKGSLVIKKGNNNIFFVRIKCGYRGTSSFEVLSNASSVHKFNYRHSPNGALGVSEMGVIETPEKYVKIQWKRSGRLYGEPSRGVSLIKLDGTVEKLDNISDQEMEEILDE